MQIGNEFAASQHHIAIAVWFDNQAPPRLTANFCAQSVEGRNQAMMLVQYRLDLDFGVEIPGIPAVLNNFILPVEPIALALAQEKQVTSRIATWLARGGRASGDLAQSGGC
nr:ferritin-like domain-containing protein [Cryobacterium algoritolerans]